MGGRMANEGKGVEEGVGEQVMKERKKERDAS